MDGLTHPTLLFFDIFTLDLPQGISILNFSLSIYRDCASGAPKSFAADEKPLALDMALCHGLVLRVSDHIAGFMQPDIICIQPGGDHFHIKVQLVSHFYSIHLAIHAELCDAGNL